MGLELIRWFAALTFAFLLGKLMTRIKLPAILGWLIGECCWDRMRWLCCRSR